MLLNSDCMPESNICRDKLRIKDFFKTHAHKPNACRVGSRCKNIFTNPRIALELVVSVRAVVPKLGVKTSLKIDLGL